MFISGSAYLENVRAILSGGETVDVAVAFWGEGAELLFSEGDGCCFRVICNLAGGGSNPTTVAHLRNLPHVELKQMDDLHAKVLIGSTTALIGSANFSANGLRLDGNGARGWNEAGLLTRDAAMLRDARLWFAASWEIARSVRDEDLVRAADLWARRPNARPPTRAASLLQLTPGEARDAGIYVVVWAKEASLAASAAAKHVVEQAATLSDGISQSVLSFYEDWNELPENASLISFKLLRNGRCNCDGVYRRVPELDVPANREHDGVQIVVKQKAVLTFPLCSRKQMSELSTRIAPVFRNLPDDFWRQQGGAVVPFHWILTELARLCP